MIFDCVFKTMFDGFWYRFLSKKLSKMRGVRVVFSTSLRTCEKCAFEWPSIVFTIFFNFESIDFRLKGVTFKVVFPKVLLRGTFCRCRVEFWSRLDAKWEPKSRPRAPLSACKKCIEKMLGKFHASRAEHAGNPPCVPLKELKNHGTWYRALETLHWCLPARWRIQLINRTCNE